MPAALAAAKGACPADSYMVMVDDRDRAARLDAALREHGCSHDESTVYLALTGPMVSPVPGPDRLEVASIESAELETWAQVKLQSFADSEDAPAAKAVTAEVAARRRELPLAEYQLGVIDGEPVAVLAHYPGADDLVFILGTRTPYRRLGFTDEVYWYSKYELSG